MGQPATWRGAVVTGAGDNRWSRLMTRGLVRGPLQLHVAVTLRLKLARTQANHGRHFVAREVVAAELDDALAGAGLQVQGASDVGRTPWRAFLVMDGERPIHHTFVTFERRVPRLFKVHTNPAYRRRGAFEIAVPAVARALVDSGYTSLESSCNGANVASLAAHRRAGFRIVDRRWDAYVLGVALRSLPSRGRALLRATVRRYR